MDRKEQWIDEVMNSLAGIKQAQAPEGMKQRILAQLSGYRPAQLLLPKRVIWSLAAALLLLIGANIISMVHFNKEQKRTAMKDTSEQLANEYFNSISN